MPSEQMENLEEDYKYVGQLPYEVIQKLSEILDLNDYWKILGEEYMNFHRSKLEEISRSKSPTQQLLYLWGHYCYQENEISQLFWFLTEMKQFEARNKLAPYVNEKSLVKERIKPIKSDPLPKVDFNQSNSMAQQNGVVAPQNSMTNPKNENEKTSFTDFIHLDAGLPFIDYEVLEESTGFWSEDRKLGHGGFGDVYQGVLKQTVMAIKHFRPQKKHEKTLDALVDSLFRDLLKELKLLNSNRHDNILPVYGYSYKDGNFCLVSQFMPNGSLDDRLRCQDNTLPLCALTRCKIARGTAMGLQFLHDKNKPLFHGDMKSANVLLDLSFEPKIGDFGLSREGSSGRSYVKLSTLQGTRPYLPHEFFSTRKLNAKVDTYSFGVVLFEIISGLRAYDVKTKTFLKDYILKLDEEGNLLHAFDPKTGFSDVTLWFAENLFMLGKQCVSKAKQRPTMMDVARDLNRLYLHMKKLGVRGLANDIIDPTRKANSYLPAGAAVPKQRQIAEVRNQQPIHNQREAASSNSVAAVSGLQNMPVEILNEMLAPAVNNRLETTEAQFGSVHGLVDHLPQDGANIYPEFVNAEASALGFQAKSNRAVQNGGELDRAEVSPEHSSPTDIHGNKLPLVSLLQQR